MTQTQLGFISLLDLDTNPNKHSDYENGILDHYLTSVTLVCSIKMYIFSGTASLKLIVAPLYPAPLISLDTDYTGGLQLIYRLPTLCKSKTKPAVIACVRKIIPGTVFSEL